MTLLTLSVGHGYGAACLAFCNDAPWAAGTTADAAGNTIGCRQYHAVAAANNEHCTHAGPTGADVCGRWCDVYCAEMLDACPTTYADLATCAAACALFPTGGTIGAATGNTVQCRIYHAGAANNDAHCDHADADSAAGTCQ